MSLPATVYDPIMVGPTDSRIPHPNPPTISKPIFAQHDSQHTQLAAGVAIFHLASSRVVVCFHTRERYYFLPKGRKDAGETIERAACREGFEESGYKCRLLPLPQTHRQPAPAETWGDATSELSKKWSTEPFWTQLAPNSRATQYILFWYVAETVPPDVEEAVNQETASAVTARATATTSNGVTDSIAPYIAPPPFPPNITLAKRIEQDKDGYVPPRQENTGVDEEEAFYEASLMPIEEALQKLSATSGVMADVVRQGWEGIQARLMLEERESHEKF